MFLPPASWGRDMRSKAIRGGASESHKKVLMHLVRYVLYVCGIPWASVENWVFPPIIICIMCWQPSMLGYALFHCLRLVSISSMILVHGSFPDGVFLTWSPRHQVVSPSLRMWIDSGNMKSFWLFRDWCVLTSFLYLSNPTGIT